MLSSFIFSAFVQPCTVGLKLFQLSFTIFFALGQLEFLWEFPMAPRAFLETTSNDSFAAIWTLEIHCDNDLTDNTEGLKLSCPSG